MAPRRKRHLAHAVSVMLLATRSVHTFDKQACSTASASARQACATHMNYLMGLHPDTTEATLYGLCGDGTCLSNLRDLRASCSGYPDAESTLTEDEQKSMQVRDAVRILHVCNNTCAKTIMVLPSPSTCLRQDACPAAGPCVYFNPLLGNETDKELILAKTFNKRIPCARARSIQLPKDELRSCQEYFCDIERDCASMQGSILDAASLIGGAARSRLLSNLTESMSLLTTAFKECETRPLQCSARLQATSFVGALIALASSLTLHRSDAH